LFLQDNEKTQELVQKANLSELSQKSELLDVAVS
jgi:hypothetical protein